MILSSTVFGGESPKEDRIGIILSLMTGMRDRMDNMEKNIENINNKDSKIEDEIIKIVKKTDATDSKISSMQSKISATDSKINGIDSKITTIESEVEDVQKSAGWTFVGMGTGKRSDDYYNAGSDHSLAPTNGLQTTNGMV